MTKTINYYRQIIKVLTRLKTIHPTYNLGRHISTALDESNIWGISDKEFLYALEKYETELNIDYEHDEDIEEIIKNGMNINKMFLEEEEED